MNNYRKSGPLVTAMRRMGMFDPPEWGQAVPLESLKPVQDFKVKKLLALLNQGEARSLLFPSSLPQIVNDSLLSATGEILRSWIDEWLDSGRSKNGDEPRARTFEKAKTVATIATKFSSGRVLLSPRGDSLSLWIATYDPESSETRPEEYAGENLVFFLLSEFRYKLARCRNGICGKYFLLSHIERLYKRGTLCDFCQHRRSQDSAKVATANERKNLRLALHLEAAKRFGKQIKANGYWYKNEVIKAKIAGFLNAKFGEKEAFRAAYPKGLTGKWVANVKNWKPIEKVATGGK